MLVVPVLEDGRLAGVLEVFGTDPAEFVESDQNLLEIFAREAARIVASARELERRLPAPFQPPQHPQQPFFMDSAPLQMPLQPTRGPYEAWTLVVGTIAILMIIALSFLIGSRIGWLGRPSGAVVPARLPVPASEQAAVPQTAPAKQPPKASGSSAKVPSSDGGLVVYEQGKVIFRMNPASPKQTVPPASPDTTAAGIARVWLAADLAESRLVQRSEPHYPAEALAAHRSGNVVLEVVVGEDGSVTSTRPVSGDPLLTAAAADAVRNWHYEPYRVQGHPAQFQTDVTLKFSLPD
jgi:TonB family protein